MKSCAITGRRPKNLPWLEDEMRDDAIAFKNRLKYRLASLVESGYMVFYVGMAEGVDTYVAEILFELRNIYRDIEVVAVIPYKGFCDRWRSESKKRYYRLLSLCDDVKILYDEPSNSAIFLRNKYMVDNADILLAVYDNVKNGGTYNTLKYAKSVGKEVIIEGI